jgi:hemoglobin
MSELKTPYERLGGAHAVRTLVERFYAFMDTLPEAKAIRAMHPSVLNSSREKLFQFLSGWLGGPPLYIERHGHPRLRLRHMPFAIDDAESEAWMLCMVKALDECVEDPQLRADLHGAFQRMAQHLRNHGEFQRPEDQ